MSVLRLYPAPQEERSLEGLYLSLNLHRQAADGDVLIYSNYIASMDGRISLRDANTGQFIVPEAISNKRDCRTASPWNADQGWSTGPVVSNHAPHVARW